METDVEIRVEDDQDHETSVLPVEESSEEKPQLVDLAHFLRRTRALVPLAVIGLFLLAVTAALNVAQPFIMPIVIALMLTFLLKPMVTALARIHIPETIGAVLVIAVFFSLISFAVSRLVQPATEWAAKAPETVSTVQEKVRRLLRRAEPIKRAAEQVGSITQSATGTEPTQKVEVQHPIISSNVMTYTKSLIAGLIETVVLLYFMLAAGDLFMQKLVRTLPTLRDKKKAVEITTELQHSLSTFLFTITLINVVLGIVVGCASFLLGLPNPVLWGVLAGALNFIPYFGPITGVVVLLIAGTLTFDSFGRAIVAPIVYLSLHAVEANVITPMILGRRLTLNPLVIFISLMFWTWLWGIPGAFLSIPMLMMLKIFCDHFKPLAPIGEFLSG